MRLLFNHLQSKSYFFHIQKILKSLDIVISVSIVIYITCMHDLVYQILKPYIRFVLTGLFLDENIIVDLIYCNLKSAQMTI